jgi:GntR family transcriptional repressor for pyruvate dehydrogenase complex
MQNGELQQKPFVRLKIPKASEIVAERIRSAILMGELPEGAGLPSEKELMVQLGLSRASVREGLRLLEAEGLITTRAGRGGGATVSRPRTSGHTRSLAALLQFDGITLDELFEAWSAISPVCCRVAARHITPEQLAEMRAQIENMARSIGNSRAFTAEEVRFHMLIAEATNNPVLRIYGISLSELTYKQIHNIEFTTAEMQAGVQACRAVLESLEHRDALQAERRVARHLLAVEADITRQAWPLNSRPAEVTGVMDHLTQLAGNL